MSVAKQSLQKNKPSSLPISSLSSTSYVPITGQKQATKCELQTQRDMNTLH